MILLQADTHFEWLPKSLHELLEMIAFISLIVGGLSVFFLWKADRLAKNNGHFLIINSCMMKYVSMSNKINRIEKLPNEERRELLFQYIMLVEEELHYIKHKSIPEDKAKEWLTGIVNTLSRFYLTAPSDYDEVLKESYSKITTFFTPTILKENPTGNIGSLLVAIRTT